jgi:putative addiction module CopG family antidote
MEATLNLGDRLERFVEEQIREGRYADASEVVRAGLLLLERSLEQEDEPPHEPEVYERWFRAKVEEALREADRPDAVWVPHEEVEADWVRERAEIEAEIAAEEAEAGRRTA